MEVVITAFIAAVFAAAKSEFSVNVETSSIIGSIVGTFISDAFCIISPSGDNSKFGIVPDKLVPQPNADFASVTRVSKLNPLAVNSEPNFDVMSASKFADCVRSTNPLKLCSWL